MASEPDPKKETPEEKAERLHQEKIAAVHAKYAAAPHPKSEALTKADLSLLEPRSVQRILIADAKRQRRKQRNIKNELKKRKKA